MRDPLVTGFALLTDDPLMPDVEHCLEPDVKVININLIYYYDQTANFLVLFILINLA